YHRHRIRRPLHLRRKQLRHRRTRHKARRVVPIPQDRLPLVRGEDLNTAERTIGIGNYSLQQPNKPLRKPLNALLLKQVARVFHNPGNARGRAVRRALLGKAQRQIKLRARAPHLLKPRLNPGQLKRRLRLVLQHQHHLEQRMTRKRPRRVEHLDQTLKRQVLVRVRRQIARANPTNQLGKARIARHIRPQRQRVHEQPDPLVQRRVRAPRTRAADHDVLARPQPAQQRGQASLQHHEQARSARTRQLHELAVQLTIKPQQNTPAPVARNRRPSMVNRQLNLIRHPRQPTRPELKLARNHARRVALLPQNRALPQRIVRILHRQRRKRRRSPTTPRRIRRCEITRQRRERPPVARNVVQHNQQNVLARAKRKQMRAQRHVARKIKSHMRRSRQCIRQARLAHLRAHEPRPCRVSSQDLLARNPKPLREDRAQALVPLDNVAQRRLQRRNVQITAQPQRQRDRVGRAATLQPIQKPQPPLRIRQRDLRRTRNPPQRRTRCLPSLPQYPR